MTSMSTGGGAGAGAVKICKFVTRGAGPWGGKNCITSSINDPMHACMHSYVFNACIIGEFLFDIINLIKFVVFNMIK